jgi:hypothetical protein
LLSSSGSVKKGMDNYCLRKSSKIYWGLVGMLNKVMSYIPPFVNRSYDLIKRRS